VDNPDAIGVFFMLQFEKIVVNAASKFRHSLNRDWEDLVQDIWAKLCSVKLDHLEEEEAFKLAKAIVWNYLRREYKSQKEAVFTSLEDYTEDTSSEGISIEDKIAINQVMSKEDVKISTAINLIGLGYKKQNISRYLGICNTELSKRFSNLRGKYAVS
jgi:DNA-directed RNA polymerase specialized sigma24 family protein